MSGSDSPSLAGLSPEKRKVFSRLLKEKGIGVLPTEGVPRRKDATQWPLSFAQRRLWLLDRLEPGSPRYNVFSAVSLGGRLDLEALERALTEILRRHEILRARIIDMAGEPVQRIEPLEAVALPLTDLRGWPEEQRPSELRRLATEEARLPFDLARGPLIRCSIVRSASEQHTLFLSLHHIVSDAWSLSVVLYELRALYGAFSEGRPSPLPEPLIQYADFAAWQRDSLSGEVLERQLSYWRDQLAGADSLSLPTDRPRPPAQSLAGAWHFRTFGPGLREELKAFSRREGVTLFMTLLAAFQALLHRYTWQVDISVGSPVAARTHAELEGLVGFFANMLVFRTDLSGDPSFRELVARVRGLTMAGFANQEAPFEKLVEELRPERDLARHPLFQVAFTLQNAPRPAPPKPGLTWSAGGLDNGVAKFDLTLYVTESEDSLAGAFEYSTELFDEPTVARMLGHLEELLKGVAGRPQARLSELPLLGEGEAGRLQIEGNAPAVEYPREATVTELFEGQVERTPDELAVVFGEERLTYRELNARANRLAHRLRG
ncbi:MAG TPA: condensation domain-containing protein, partial [Vicinamibacteria bacterium]|nr:condensation domain-containing protein [Vicinamibacteria bacterium]